MNEDDNQGGFACVCRESMAFLRTFPLEVVENQSFKKSSLIAQFPEWLTIIIFKFF